MLFVDLKRCFVPISKDQDADLNIGLVWGRKIAGWLEWSDLLEHRRVVLLAEASSGKTEEFRHQAEILTAQGKAAFFVRVEDLADGSLEAALDPTAVDALQHWCDIRTDEDGWFFLDSVDEARLNHKSFEKALRCFARELKLGLERAHIFVSCRVSDWKGGEDRAAIGRLLPVWKKPVIVEQQEIDAALLDPLFKAKQGASRHIEKEQPERDLDALFVAQLIPLGADQRRLLATVAGIERSNAFVEAIEQNGLGDLAERPGDLLDLAEYWKSNGHFGPLVDMTEHGVSRKLSEQNKYRRDNSDLPSDKARKGAERLAAALTLAKSFTLRAPGHNQDLTLAAGALDPADLLDDWTDAERNALMRRGIFMPSTYGRIRFHHRGTQEYLMARWLDRLLRQGCPLQAVWDIIFAERYGIETLVPSLHATAAWLALYQTSVRDEIIRREPLVLLRHGDPRSLPLEAKERLLLNYASRHAVGEISNDSLDHRALWMFATPELSGTIRQAWAMNNRYDFHVDLLRLIREGTIYDCVDLARAAAVDEKAEDYLREIALEALNACEDTEGLAATAQWLKSAVGRVSENLGPYFCKILFPRYLTVDELLALVEASPSPSEGSMDGFGRVLCELWNACHFGDRVSLLLKLANLALSPPFKTEYMRISLRHCDLAENLGQLAREALRDYGGADIPEGLIRVLMAVERGERDRSRDKEGPSFQELVAGNSHVQRKLFWADVEETRQFVDRNENRPTSVWQIYFHGRPLWQFGSRDLVWLFEDLSDRSLKDDQQIALSAIVSVLRAGGDLDAEVPRLRGLVAGIFELEQDLEGYIRAPIESELVRQQRMEGGRRERENVEKTHAEKEAWIKFREDLSTDPAIITNPIRLSSWEEGAASKLFYLSLWLQHRTDKGTVEASLQWRLIEEAFGRQIADAYRDGIKALWRVTPPERPMRNGNNYSTKKITVLSFAGLGVEASENPDWASRLSSTEAERAIKHACLSEQGNSSWIEALVDKHPTIVLPVLSQVLHEEWSGQRGGCSEFFSRFGRVEAPIQSAVQDVFFQIITGKKPKGSEILGLSLNVLRRLDLSEVQRSKLASLARRRLRALQKINDIYVLHYLTMLSLVDADAATIELVTRVSKTPSNIRSASTSEILGALFGRDNTIAVFALDCASVTSLEALLRLAYKTIRPENDRVRKGVYTPDMRDKAEEARNTLLSALLNRPGADAYRSMRAMATDRAFHLRAIRFNELSRGKAEQDAEPPPWGHAEVLAFERRHVAPAKTGEALLRIVMGVLSELNSSFANADATSRSLLERAKNEAEVQEWLTEQMNLRSQGRFHAHREVQVARGDKPDIIVSSTASPFEVAVELKHGGMGWSVRDLEKALTQQLTEFYLKPITRRQGVLVISHHGLRTWRDPDTKAKLEFMDLIKRLQALAASVVRNEVGAVEVCAFGIDTSGR